MTFNLASWFVDRHLEEGRGDRTALLTGEPRGHLRRARRARQPRRPRAARPRRAPGGARAARALRRRRVRRHLVRRAEDRRGHRRGLHLPAGQGLRLLPGLHAGGRGRGRRDDASTACARRARSWATGRGRARCWPWASRPKSCARARRASTRSSRRRPPRSTPRPPTPDDIAIWKFTTGSTGMPKACVHRDRDAAAQLRALRARRARHPRGRRRAAGAEAVLRLRARPGGALPVRRRRRGHRLPRAFDARADLRARRPPPADDPRQRADDDPRHARAARARPVVPAAVHLGGRGAAGGAAPPLAGQLRRRGARRHRLVRGLPHLPLQPAGRRPPRDARPGRAGLRRAGRRRRRARAARRRDRPAVDRGRHGRAHVLAGAREVERDLRGRRGHERRPLRARRRRLLPLPRPRRRPAQGRRHLGRTAGDRAVPHRARRRGRVRRRRLRGGGPAEAAGVRRPARAGDARCRRRCRRT